MKIYNKTVALYLRLSKEDKNESIDKQLKLLLDYLNNNGIRNYKTYIDDGYTGTNFNRPSFKKMILDIEAKLIDTIIVKDLSRLGRDYIKLGEFVEHYFPTHNIRFISINDNIDTQNDSAYNDILPFKSILNDLYAKDLSKKIRSSIKIMQNNGLWTGGCIPLGYKQSKKKKNKLIVNPKEKEIVEAIFSLALKLNTINDIKNELNKNNQPTLSKIRKNKNTLWSTTTIKNILNNEVYIGNLVQNKHQRLSYKYRVTINNPKAQWIKCNNTHDAIIDKDTFFKVQKKFNNKKINKNLLNNVYCFECKHKLSIRKGRNNKKYFCCNFYKNNLKNKCCTAHAFSYSIFIKEFFESIKENNVKLDKICKIEISKDKNVYIFLS